MAGLKTDKSDTCQQCSNPAKYTCPGCLWRTCSVPCIKQHKLETHCTGLRDKVKYKPMSQMDDLDILNDYRLLEEIGRQVEVAGRGAPARGRHGAPPPLRPAQHRLRRAARKRGVRLDFMPEGFQRRRENTTQLERISDVVLWRVEWRLPLADTVRTDDRVPETRRLSEALKRHLSAKPPADAAKEPAETAKEPAETAKEDPLQFYRAAYETGSVRVFLQAERVQQGDRYVELPLTKTLAACLKDRLVIEFPILIVTTEEHADRYRTDRIEESFFSLCRREQEAQRRARRAQRRRGPACTPAAKDEPGRKVPRPQLDGVTVVTGTGQTGAAPEPTPEPAVTEQEQVQEPEQGQEPEQEPGVEAEQATEAEHKPEPVAERKAAAAGFGLFGVDDSDLSD